MQYVYRKNYYHEQVVHNQVMYVWNQDITS